MTLLVGDATSYSDTWWAQCPDGTEQAIKFTALETGIVTTLRLHVSTTQVSNYTSIMLGVRADASGPATLIDSGTASGPPSLGDQVDVTGLSIPVIAGSSYWLCLLPLGGVARIHAAVEAELSLGTPDIYSSSSEGSMGSSWPGGSTDEQDGPYGFQGLGDVAAPTPITGLDFHVTGLWYPDADSVDYYGRIADPIDGQVVIPLNDSRTASVAVSVYDPIVAALHEHTYARCLKVYYNGTLVFWGPAKLNEGDSEAGTVKISAVDPSLRAIRHYLRRDDIGGELNANNGDRATVPIDRDGIELILDAARNIPGQTARGCPDIGIALGTNYWIAAPTDLIGVSRGDPVWDAELQLVNALGPDLELEPVDNTPGVYCQLNTYIVQGADRRATVHLHYGTGFDNVEKITWVEGGKYITHAHVLSRDQSMRRTAVNVEASAETGQYTDWDVTDFDSHGVPVADAERVLDSYGEDLLKAYGRPLMVYAVTLPVESTGDGPGTVLRYLTDYAVGDIIDVAGKVGLITLADSDYRITQVTLTQEDDAVRPTLDIVPDRTSDDTIGGSDE